MAQVCRILALALLLLPICAFSADPLLFPKDAFTTEARNIKTATGDHTVRYRAYRHIPYVAKPVDKEFESLDVDVPVEIDGAPVDAANAPVLFSIPVGGYMSASNLHPRGPGAPGRRRGNSRKDLALAAGFVVVTPGCRGRDNRTAEGINYGKAPAAIVDLKAAIRYLRQNAGNIPGNMERIVPAGVSAGGALAALLGASGDSPLYAADLKQLGAAETSDRVFAAAAYCPIIDLEHADMAYEWMFGGLPSRNGTPDPGLSKQLKDAFTAYQASLKLEGRGGFGALTAANYADYLLEQYLYPSAERFLNALPKDKRDEYLDANLWIHATGKGVRFEFADYLRHIGRLKGLPAFDDFAGRAPEPNLFGTRTVDSRHFTLFSLRHATGNPNASLDDDIPALLDLMNPMHFTGLNHPGIAEYWWIRHGSSDRDTSLPVIVNLVTSLENRGKNVNARLYWDAGHAADEDPEDFIAWIAAIAGKRRI